MRKILWWKRLKAVSIITGVVSVFLAAGVISLSVYVNTGQFRALLLEKVNAAIAGDLSIGSHTISLWSGSIVCKKVAFRDALKNPLVLLDKLRIDFAYLPLLKRIVFIEALELQHPDIRVSKQENGSFDILEALRRSGARMPEKKEAEPRRSALQLVARYLAVADGGFRFVEDAGHRRLEVKGVTLKAGADLPEKSGKIQLTADETVLFWKNRRLDVRPFGLSAVLTRNRLHSIQLNADSDVARLNLTGSVGRLFTDPDLDLQLSCNLSLAALRRMPPLPTDWTGTLTGSVHATGNWRNPNAKIRLDYKGGRIAGYSVDHLTASLNLADRLLSLKRLDVQAGSAALALDGSLNLKQALPNGLVALPFYSNKSRYHLNLRAIKADLSVFDPMPGHPKGVLNASASLFGKGFDMKNLSLAGDIEALVDGMWMEGMHRSADLKLVTSGKLTGSLLEIHRAHLSAADTHVNASGAVDFEAGRLFGEVFLDVEDINNPLSLFENIGSSGSASISAAVSGLLKNPDVKAEGVGRGLILGGIRLGDVDVKAHLNEQGRLDVSSLTVSSGNSRVALAGNIKVFESGLKLRESMPLQAQVKVAHARLQDFWNQDRVKGIFDAKMDIGGTLAALRMQADIRGSHVAYQRFPLGEMKAKARFEQGKLFVPQFTLLKNSTRATLSGDLRLFEPQSWQRAGALDLKADFALENVLLEDYSKDIKGDITLRGRIEGPVPNLKGRGSLTGEKLDFGVQRLKRIDVALVLENQRLHASPLTAVAPTGDSLRGSGWYDFNGMFAFDLFAENLNLDSIDRLELPENAAGVLKGHVWGRGTTADPSFFGDVYVSGIRINNETLDDIHLQAELAHNQFSLRGRQSFDLRADYHLLNKNFHLDLVFAETNLSPFFLVLGRPEVSGSVTGELVAQGDIRFLKESEASMDISSLALNYQGESLVLADRLQLELRRQRLSLPECRFTFSQSGELSIQGSGSLNGDVAVTVRGDIPANMAGMLNKNALNMEGRVRIRAELKGPFSDPEVSGDITLQNVEYAVPEPDLRIQQVMGSIKLTTSRVVIEEISGRFNSGVFRMGGTVELDRFRPVNIQLTLKGTQIPIQIPETMDMTINTELLATGTMRNLSITGDVIILEGSYYKKVKLNLIQQATEKKRPEVPAAPTVRESYLDRISLDIQLKYRDPFIVDNNIAYLEILPDLSLSGTLGAPVVSGIAKTRAGTLTYQNKEFTVDKGIIRFANPYKIEPEIDVAGSVQVRKWNISLLLNGSPDRLRVELSSTPPEEDADIISLLVFGKTTYEMGSGAVASPEALLARLIASSFGEDIKNATGLDTLEVETETNETAGESDTINVTMGKDLTERLSVKYKIGSAGSEYDQRAVTEYKLLENIMLSGFQDIKGSYGGEIIFRVEFR